MGSGLLVGETVERFPGLLGGEECAGEFERFSDYVVHVHIPVGGQPAQEEDFFFGLRQLPVPHEQRLVLLQPLRVVGHIIRSGFLAVFDLVKRLFVMLPGRKVLVLVDARVGYMLLAIVEHRVSLVVACGVVPLKIDGAITEAAIRKVEIGVERTGVEDVVEIIVPLQGVGGVELHFDTRGIEYALHDLGVSIHGYALVGAVIVIVVVVESHRQAFEDRGRELFRINSPLFDGITPEESLVELFSHHFQGLLLKVLGFVDAVIA